MSWAPMVFMLPMATLAQAAQEPASGATFEITFESLWSPQTHPVDFPPDPHFSEFTGVTHNASVSFWTPGRLATQGVKDIAERGREAQFLKEIDRAITAGSASTKFNIDGFYQETTPSTKVTINAQRAHPLLSLITMLAPSPDWFVGLHDFELMPNGTWLEEAIIHAFTYDSGTDSGATYTSRNQATTPPTPITRVQVPLVYQGEVKPTVKITIRRIQ